MLTRRALLALAIAAPCVAVAKDPKIAPVVYRWTDCMRQAEYISDGRGVVAMTTLALLDAPAGELWIDIYDRLAHEQLGVEPSTRYWSVDASGNLSWRRSSFHLFYVP